MADYRCFNDFFYRKLRPGARPIDEPTNQSVISSAADCRLTVYTSVDKAKEFWIKVSWVWDLWKDGGLNQRTGTEFYGCELAQGRFARCGFRGRRARDLQACTRYFACSPSSRSEILTSLSTADYHR